MMMCHRIVKFAAVAVSLFLIAGVSASSSRASAKVAFAKAAATSEDRVFYDFLLARVDAEAEAFDTVQDGWDELQKIGRVLRAQIMAEYKDNKKGSIKLDISTRGYPHHWKIGKFGFVVPTSDWVAPVECDGNSIVKDHSLPWPAPFRPLREPAVTSEDRGFYDFLFARVDAHAGELQDWWVDDLQKIGSQLRAQIIENYKDYGKGSIVLDGPTRTNGAHKWKIGTFEWVVPVDCDVECTNGTNDVSGSNARVSPPWMRTTATTAGGDDANGASTRASADFSRVVAPKETQGKTPSPLLRGSSTNSSRRSSTKFIPTNSPNSSTPVDYNEHKYFKAGVLSSIPQRDARDDYYRRDCARTSHATKNTKMPIDVETAEGNDDESETTGCC